MASIYTIEGGPHAALVTLDSATGVLSTKAAISILAGVNLEVDVRETEDTGASNVVRVVAPVAPNALALNALTIAIDESPQPGETLGTATATGGLGGYTFSAGAGNNGAISVAANGSLTTSASLGALATPTIWQYATAPSFTFPVAVSDGTSTATGNITINLNQVVAAPAGNDATTTISESATVSTSIATAADFGLLVSEFDEAAIVAGNAAGKFTINASTGEITLAATVDALVTSSYGLTVRFTLDDNGSALSSFYTLGITVQISNRAPSLAIAGATTSLAEATDTTNTVTVGTIQLTEIDGNLGTNVLTISGADASDFELGTASTVGGVTSYPLLLSAGTSLDFTVKTSYAITITSADATLPGEDQTLNYTLTITDSNTAPTAPTTAAFSLLDSAAVSDVVGTIAVSDAQSSVTATIQADDPSSPGRFAVADNGQITVAQALPSAATQGTHTQTIRWTDDRGLFSETVVTYTVSSGFRITDQTFTVDEDASVGFTVATLPAAFNGEALTYAITAGNTGSAFAFSANALQTAAALDFDTLDTYALTVSATDTNGSDSATITVNLNDIADPIVAPTISGGPFAVDENEPIGTTVGTLTIDKGNDAAATVSLVLNQGFGTLGFAVDNDGVITTTRIFNFEAEASQNLTATITNTDSSASVNFTVNINNLNEFTYTPESSFKIPSSSLEVSGGTVIGTAQVLTTTIFNAAATGPTNAEVLFTVDSATDCKFKLSGTDTTTFTRADIIAGDVTFVAVSPATTGNYFNSLDTLAPAFTVTVSDTGASGVASVQATFTPTFTAEFVASDIIDAGVIPNTELRSISIGDTAANTTMVLAGGITGGQFERVSAPGTAIFSWTQAEVDADNITVIQTGAISITNLNSRGSNNELGTPISDSIPDVTLAELSLASASAELADTESTGFSRQLAQITNTDPNGETFTYGVSNSAFFEIVNSYGNNFLNLKSGVTLDAVASPTITTDVTLDGDANGAGVDDTESFTLNVLPVEIDPNSATIYGPDCPRVLVASNLDAVDKNSNPVTITFTSISNAVVKQVDGDATISTGTGILLSDIRRGEYYIQPSGGSAPSWTITAATSRGTVTGSTASITYNAATVDVTTVGGSGVTDYASAETFFNSAFPASGYTIGTTYYYSGADGFARSTAQSTYGSNSWAIKFFSPISSSAPGSPSANLNNASNLQGAQYLYKEATRWRLYTLGGYSGSRTWTEQTTA